MTKRHKLVQKRDKNVNLGYKKSQHSVKKIQKCKSNGQKATNQCKKTKTVDLSEKKTQNINFGDIKTQTSVKKTQKWKFRRQKVTNQCKKVTKM